MNPPRLLVASASTVRGSSPARWCVSQCSQLRTSATLTLTTRIPAMGRGSRERGGQRATYDPCCAGTRALNPLIGVVVFAVVAVFSS